MDTSPLWTGKNKFPVSQGRTLTVKFGGDMNELRKRRGTNPLKVDVSFLENSTTKSSFRFPFQKGKVCKYVSGIMLFLDGKPRKKKEVLIAIYGAEAVENRGMGSGQLASTFTALRNTGILAYDDAIRCWVPGDNYATYIIYLLQFVILSPVLKENFLELFDNCATNTEFYMKHILKGG